MRFDDFARPEQMIRWAGKLCLAILGLLLLPSMLNVLIAALPGFAIIGGVAMASLVAYAFRESERGRGRRTQQAGGAERTPILPADAEDL